MFYVNEFLPRFFSQWLWIPIVSLVKMDYTGSFSLMYIVFTVPQQFTQRICVITLGATSKKSWVVSNWMDDIIQLAISEISLSFEISLLLGESTKSSMVAYGVTLNLKELFSRRLTWLCSPRSVLLNNSAIITQALKSNEA